MAEDCEKMRASATISFLGHTFHLKLQHFNTPVAPTMGVSARIPHTSEYMLFMDYDNIKDERLVDELQYLQELYYLGDFHVLATNEFGRHSICIDRLRMRDAVEVIENSSCDYNFKRGIHINEFRTWILRVLEKGSRPKPQYFYPVESPYNGKRLQSEAMGLFLQHYYGARVRLANPDGAYELEVQGYKTGSKLNVKKLKKIAEALH